MSLSTTGHIVQCHSFSLLLLPHAEEGRGHIDRTIHCRPPAIVLRPGGSSRRREPRHSPGTVASVAAEEPAAARLLAFVGFHREPFDLGLYIIACRRFNSTVRSASRRAFAGVVALHTAPAPILGRTDRRPPTATTQTIRTSAGRHFVRAMQSTGRGQLDGVHRSADPPGLGSPAVPPVGFSRVNRSGVRPTPGSTAAGRRASRGCPGTPGAFSCVHTSHSSLACDSGRCGINVNSIDVFIGRFANTVDGGQAKARRLSTPARGVGSSYPNLR